MVSYHVVLVNQDIPWNHWEVVHSFPILYSVFCVAPSENPTLYFQTPSVVVLLGHLWDDLSDQGGGGSPFSGNYSGKNVWTGNVFVLIAIILLWLSTWNIVEMVRDQRRVVRIEHLVLFFVLVKAGERMENVMVVPVVTWRSRWEPCAVRGTVSSIPIVVTVKGRDQNLF